MKPIRELMTIVMTTYAHPDFTKASIAAVRRFFDGRIILANGSKDSGVLDIDNVLIMNMLGADPFTRGAKAIEMVDTPYLCGLDTDVKITRDIFPELLGLMESAPSIGQMGDYAVIVKDWDKHQLAFSTQFNANMDVDGFITYFSLSRTDALLRAMDAINLPFYDDIPPELCTSEATGGAPNPDLSLGKRMKQLGYRLVTPARPLGIIHWLGVSGAFRETPFAAWWKANTDHRRCDPLNDWHKIDWDSPRLA
jgi:hypothetical protein